MRSWEVSRREQNRRLQSLPRCSTDPQFLVLDEPLSGLDPKTQRFVNNWIKIIASRGITVFLSTHNLDIAQDYANKIAIIDRGKIVAVGELNSLRKMANTRDDARLDDVFLKLTESA